MPDEILAHRDDDSWCLRVDGHTIDFSDGGECEKAARMLAGPGKLLVIDRRDDVEELSSNTGDVWQLCSNNTD